MSQLAEQIQQDVSHAISKDELELPTLPEVALKIRDVAERPDVNAAGLSEVIGEDAGLAARLIKVANSPMFRATRPIEELHIAVSRLGVDYAANLATGLAMRQMFQATSEMIDRKLRQVWSDSTEIAAICGVLARNYTGLKTDQATLAGLTHAIGVLPILSWAEENDGIIRDSMTLDKVIDSMHGRLGSMILSNWDFPMPIAMVPSEYQNFSRTPDSTDYVDVVTVAYLQSLSETDHPHAKLDWSEVTAFERLGLDPNVEDEDMEALFEELEETVSAISG